MKIEYINRDNEFHRAAYFNFLSSVFPSVDFKIWYEKGYWSNNYKPVSIFQEEEIISNVGISEMDILVNGINRKGIQLGAVGTLKQYRNKGYSRALMEYVLNNYNKNNDLVFLFANDNVLDFYPKFGFTRFNQYIYKINSAVFDFGSIKFRKMNFNDHRDYKILVDLLKFRRPVTEIFGAVNYDFISMWHILNFYLDKLYYSEKFEAIFIFEENEDTLDIYEIISKNLFDINEILAPSTKIGKEIRLYFPPDKYHFSFESKELYNESPLFISENINFRSENIKFPELAVT